MSASPLQASTTQATAAVAQSREAGQGTEAVRTGSCEGAGDGFSVGPRVFSAVLARPHERRSRTDPIYRPLRIYSLDPSFPRLEGGLALVNVPFEPLEPGPSGALFYVDDYDDRGHVRYAPVDLEAGSVLIANGRDPSPSDPQFHQQMVYAVCSLVYSAFKGALGRHVGWSFGPGPGKGSGARLRIRPHANVGPNAYYDREAGELCFGYHQAHQDAAGGNPPGGYVFTCLSHDVIAHEVTHALLDGLRAHFTHPSGADVLAFHEGFADLVALFQHFSYEQVVLAAIGRSRGELGQADMITNLARQFGQATGRAAALRTVVGPAELMYRDAGAEPHGRAQVLTSAVFEAFVLVFERKTQAFVRLATGGTGILPPGELPPDLRDLLAKQASALASQFLAICIRAIDYCPPVDLTFGEFLRAVVTADHDLVPDDPWGYRDAWITAFRRRGIVPDDVASLSQDALLWRAPLRPLNAIHDLSFAKLAFNGDPACPADEAELQRQACALGGFVSKRENLSAFGLAEPGNPGLAGDELSPPCIESIRSSRRVGPDGQIVFDMVAEVTQRRTARGGGHPPFDFYGGATVVLDPRGEFRYVVTKSVLNGPRLARQREFLGSGAGGRYWQLRDGRLKPASRLFSLMHTEPAAAGEA